MAILLPPSKTKTYKKVKKEIENWVNEHSDIYLDYSNWYCGITNNPKIRESQHAQRISDKPYFFKTWNMKSLRLSKALETSMHTAGMLNKDSKGGVKSDSWYIYVFKEQPTIMDWLFR